jgi:DNA processing protein
MSDLPSYADHLALALVPGLGPKLTAALLARFGSPAAARRATAAELLEIPHIGEKLAASLTTALRTVDIEPELDLLTRFDVRPVPLGWPGYPPPLAAVVAPPPLLYFRGAWAEADTNAIGIVGSRACTAYGRKMAEQLARGLVHAGFTIISGLARGIDGVAHKAALDAGGRTIAVLAGGLSSIYPPEHTELADQVAKQGAVVTETPMTVAPQPGMFPARNRIISGLSRAIIVVEANAKSGALITATHAGEQGREVYAVPGAADSPASAGCLELIRKGARLIRNADDVIEDLKGISTADYQTTGVRGQKSAEGETRVAATRSGAIESLPAPPPSPPPLPPLDLTQQRVFDALATKRHADELVRELSLSAGDLSRTLMQLELKKVVRRLPGNFYERRCAMSDRDALLSAIRANPDDDTPRLMFADWLDENEPDVKPRRRTGKAASVSPSSWASLIRAECEFERLRNDGSAEAAVYDFFEEFDDQTFEGVRWQRVLPDMTRRIELQAIAKRVRKKAHRSLVGLLPRNLGIWSFFETTRGFPASVYITRPSKVDATRLDQLPAFGIHFGCVTEEPLALVQSLIPDGLLQNARALRVRLETVQSVGLHRRS